MLGRWPWTLKSGDESEYMGNAGYHWAAFTVLVPSVLSRGRESVEQLHEGS